MQSISSLRSSFASHFICQCYEVSKPIIGSDYKGVEPLTRFVSAQSLIDCHLTSESALTLLLVGKEWDADILLRAIMEGTVKYIFMMHGTPEERIAKVDEYWNILPEISSVKRHDRLKAFLDEVKGHDDLRWREYVDLLLTDEQINTIRDKYNRKSRNDLDQKWSFFGMTKYFSDIGDSELKMFSHLAYGYGISSHLLHKDGVGASIVWERYRREPERQEAVRTAHAARIIRDICFLAKLRYIHLFKACNEDVSEILALDNECATFFADLEKAHADFQETEYGERHAAERT